MKIQLMANKAFENQRMLMDLNGVINFIKDNNMFMKNNEVGVYDIERLKEAMKPEEKEEFWNKVKNGMETTYDVEIKDDTFFIYKKGAKEEEKAKDKLTNVDEDKKEDDNERHEEAVEQPAKAPTKRKVSTKSKKVQGNK